MYCVSFVDLSGRTPISGAFALVNHTLAKALSLHPLQLVSITPLLNSQQQLLSSAVSTGTPTEASAADKALAPVASETAASAPKSSLCRVLVSDAVLAADVVISSSASASSIAPKDIRWRGSVKVDKVVVPKSIVKSFKVVVSVIQNGKDSSRLSSKELQRSLISKELIRRLSNQILKVGSNIHLWNESIIKILSCSPSSVTDGLFILGQTTRVELDSELAEEKRSSVTISGDEKSLFDGTQKLSSEIDSLASYSHLSKLMDIFQTQIKLGSSSKLFEGILLFGPPGCGKTSSINLLSSKLGLKLFSISASSLSGNFKQLRNLFKSAIECMESSSVYPAVIIQIDEIDSLCPVLTLSSIQDKAGVVELTKLMDSLDVVPYNIFVIGSTNRPNAIDASLRRPGRLDLEIEVPVPTLNARRSILAHYLSKSRLDDSLSIDDLARKSVGFVGADIEHWCREAFLYALEEYDEKKYDDIVLFPKHFKHSFDHVVPSSRRGVEEEFRNVSWDQIGGMKVLKKRIRTVIETPREVFQRMGLRSPKGMLLFGPPGCSKTLIAKAIASSAKEKGYSFLAFDSAALYSSYFGETEANVRRVFAKARANSPCVIFFDEVDCLVGKRSADSAPSSDSGVRERVLSTFLNEMDGLDAANAMQNSVFVLGATNFPSKMDSAILRPGRFDYIFEVPPPDIEARVEVLKIYTKKMKLSADVDLMQLAKGLDGYSGADIECVCREAALTRLRKDINAEEIDLSDFESSIQAIKPSIEDLTPYQLASKPH